MRIFRNIFLFLLFVFVGQLLLTICATAIVGISANDFARLYTGKGKGQIVLLGDSRADRNISAELLQSLTKKECINLSLGGNSTCVSEILLSDYIDRYGNPDLVVMEVSQTTVAPQSLGEMRLFSHYSRRLFEFASKVDPTFTTFQKLFPILAFNNPSFWRLASESFAKQPSRLLANSIPPAILAEWSNPHEIVRPVYRENIEALGRICTLCSERRIKIVFVIAPSWQPFRQSIRNFSTWRHEIEKAALPVRVFDYSECFFGKTQLFNDEMHLNSRGALEFVKLLREDGIL